MRRRPRSTLFPYTTLFRSEDRAVVGDVRVGELHEAPQPAELILPEQLRAQPLAPLQLREALEGGLPDRKSTRLNFSHRCISYAVFCLKKKKRIQHAKHTHT